LFSFRPGAVGWAIEDLKSSCDVAKRVDCVVTSDLESLREVNGVSVMSAFVLVIITITATNPAPTSIVTIPGFKSLKTCISAGDILIKHPGISYECVKVK
jgi:hypothetical protein